MARLASESLQSWTRCSLAKFTVRSTLPRVESFTKYWHTLRYLRPIQLYGRAWFRLARPKVDLRPAPPLRRSTGQWVKPIANPQSVFGTESGIELSATIIGKTHDISHAECWNNSAYEKLWLYNLHYFDDLCGASSAEQSMLQERLILRWVEENPPAVGSGWEPYPTSLRIVNWIKWAQAGNSLPESARQSLAVQVRWLTKRVEHHLLANHLFVNGKSLAIAGMFFDGPEADRWLDQGTRILSREIPEQILADGGNFERSPMYHAIILEDILDLINANDAWPGRITSAMVQQWRTTASGMVEWLAGLVHPDGDVSFFNDSAFAIAPTLSEIRAYANRLQIQCGAKGNEALRWFQESGYVRAECGPAVLIADIAPVGPDYQPGHAHADTLSFELSLHGQRTIVNSGTSTYLAGPQRTRERSTAAHNTVEIDRCDSSEVWGGFRVARRARIIESACEMIGENITIAAAHDGYCRLSGRPIHHRQWQLASDRLIITDTIRGGFRSAVARIYLHPTVEKIAPDVVRLSCGRQLSFAVHGGRLQINSSKWYPEFGVERESLCVELTMTDPKMTLELLWT